MKPLLTSVCSARRRASRSSLLTKLRTLSSPFEVSGKQINTANSPVIDRFYGANIMFFFPCRVWYLFVFGLPGRNDVVHLCRLTQQVFFLTYVPLLGFNCILLCNLPFFFFLHTKESNLLLLCWYEHRHDRVSHHPLFHFGTLFAKSKLFQYLKHHWFCAKITLLSYLIIELFVFSVSTEKPFLCVDCWRLVVFSLRHPTCLQESQRNSARTLACGIRYRPIMITTWYT